MRCEHVHKDQGYDDASCEDCVKQEKNIFSTTDLEKQLIEELKELKKRLGI